MPSLYEWSTSSLSFVYLANCMTHVFVQILSVLSQHNKSTEKFCFIIFR